MLDFEKNYPQYALIAGIDEAGRGPLAGPVCIAAVIMPRDKRINGVNDSKQLSAKKREELYDRIVSEAVAYNVVFVGNRIIDRINILEATRLGMEQACAGLRVMPEIVLIDAVSRVITAAPNIPIIKGDELSYNIAAASILAKVTRDRLMIEYDKKFPLYGFCRHKGYGTEEHITAIKAYGLCEIHRLTFVRNILSEAANA